MTVDERSTTSEAGSRVVERLGPHVALLVVVLGIGMAIVDPTISYSADEGAVIAQVEVLAEDGNWLRPHPVPEVDPTGRWFPLEFPVVVDDAAASYVKHPLYPLTMLPFAAVAGVPGMVAASVLGTVVAAIGAAVLARGIRPSSTIPTLWLVGVGSPLLFDAYLVIAHTLAAAAVVWGVVAALRTLESAKPARWAALAVLLLSVAALWRTEATFVGPALAVALVVGARERTRARRLWVGGLCALGSVGAYVFDGRFSRWVLGADGVDVFVIGGRGDLVSSRVNGFVNTWLRPVSGDIAVGNALLLAVPVVLAVLVVAARAEDLDRRRVQILALTAAILATAGSVLAPTDVVPGLLVAFPLLALVLVGWRSAVAEEADRVLLVTAGLYSLAVLATQYERGGTAEWGGRYFALAVPLVAPVIVGVAQRIVARLDRPAARSVALSLVAIPLVLAVVAVGSLRAAHDRTDAVVSGVINTAGAMSSDDRPVLVSVAAMVPRLSWDHLDDARWLFVPPADLDELFASAAAAGLPEVLVVTPGDLDAYVEEVEAYEVEAAETVWGNWTVTRLTPS